MPDHKQRLLGRAASLYDLHGCDAVRVVELLRTANNGTMLQAEVARVLQLTHVVATRVICATIGWIKVVHGHSVRWELTEAGCTDEL